MKKNCKGKNFHWKIGQFLWLVRKAKKNSKILEIFNFLKNTEKHLSRFFLFFKSSYINGFKPKKNPKNRYLFFATRRQSWYGPILTYPPLADHSSLIPQPIISARVAYESWCQEDSGKYWTISVGPGSPEISRVKVKNWFFAKVTIYHLQFDQVWEKGLNSHFLSFFEALKA